MDGGGKCINFPLVRIKPRKSISIADIHVCCEPCSPCLPSLLIFIAKTKINHVWGIWNVFYYARRKLGILEICSNGFCFIMNRIAFVRLRVNEYVRLQFKGWVNFDCKNERLPCIYGGLLAKHEAAAFMFLHVHWFQNVMSFAPLQTSESACKSPANERFIASAGCWWRVEV